MPEFSAGGEVWVTLHMMHEAENVVLKLPGWVIQGFSRRLFCRKAKIVRINIGGVGVINYRPDGFAGLFLGRRCRYCRFIYCAPFAFNYRQRELYGKTGLAQGCGLSSLSW